MGLECLLLVVIMFAIAGVFYAVQRWGFETPVPQNTQDFYEQLSAARKLIVTPPGTVDYGIAGWPNTHPYMTQPCLLAVDPTLFEIYNFDGRRVAAYTPKDVVWYGTPSGAQGAAPDAAGNAVYLHVYVQGRWFQVLLAFLRGSPANLLAAMKEFQPEPPRPAPYSPFAPAVAIVLEEGQHHGVARGEKVRLYFSPLELVIQRGLQELARIPTSAIDAITAEQQPDGSGHLYLRQGTERLAYALDDYVAFAGALADVCDVQPTLPAGREEPGSGDDA